MTRWCWLVPPAYQARRVDCNAQCTALPQEEVAVSPRQWNQSHLALGSAVPHSLVHLLGQGLAEFGDALMIVVCYELVVVGMTCDSLEGLLAQDLGRSHCSIWSGRMNADKMRVLGDTRMAHR